MRKLLAAENAILYQTSVKKRDKGNNNLKTAKIWKLILSPNTLPGLRGHV